MLANFQGPFSIHAVMARALKVPGNRLRLRTPPDSGGSFGVKQGVFPYIVLIAAARARRGTAGEVDRGPARASHRIGVGHQPRDDVVGGGRSRRPDPRARLGPGRGLRRVSARARACHALPHARQSDRRLRHPPRQDPQPRRRHQQDADRSRPRLRRSAGLFRAGAPDAADRDRARPRSARRHQAQSDRRRRVSVSHGDRRPARFRRLPGSASSARSSEAVSTSSRRAATRRARRGGSTASAITAVVEPSVSNMGYITTVLTAAERRKAGPKNGAQATATVSARSGRQRDRARRLRAAGAGPSHRAVAGRRRRVRSRSRATSASTPRSTRPRTPGRSRPATIPAVLPPAVAGTAQLAADAPARQARPDRRRQLNVDADDIVFADGKRRLQAQSGEPDPVLARRGAQPLVAGLAARRRRTTHPRNRVLDAAGTDARRRGRPHQLLALPRLHLRFLRRRDRSRRPADADRPLRHHARLRHASCIPAWSTARSAAALRRRVGAALYEEFAYGEDGSFLSGTFADYLVPTATEVPEPPILHLETPSPFTPLGAKGVGEGNCMSTPVCIANAVADALGVHDIDLAADAGASWQQLVRGAEPPPPAGGATAAPAAKATGGLRGEGAGLGEGAPPEAGLGDAARSRRRCSRSFPAAMRVDKLSDTHFRADVTLGVGPVQGRYRADVELSDLDPPRAVTLSRRRRPARSASAAARDASRWTPDGRAARGSPTATTPPIGGKVAASAVACSTARRASSSASSSPRWRARPAAAVRRADLAVRAAGEAARACSEGADETARIRLSPRRNRRTRRSTASREHGGDARILAGGQSLMAMLNMRLAKPSC